MNREQVVHATVTIGDEHERLAIRCQQAVRFTGRMRSRIVFALAAHVVQDHFAVLVIVPPRSHEPAAIGGCLIQRVAARRVPRDFRGARGRDVDRIDVDAGCKQNLLRVRRPTQLRSSWKADWSASSFHHCANRTARLLLLSFHRTDTRCSDRRASRSRCPAASVDSVMRRRSPTPSSVGTTNTSPRKLNRHVRAVRRWRKCVGVVLGRYRFR